MFKKTPQNKTKNLQNIYLKVLTLILTENSENNLGVYLHL